MAKLFPLGCIIMASGHSARFGSNKLLQDFHGQPLIQYILNTTQDLFAQRVVVTRYSKIAKLCHEQGIPYLLHDKPYLNDTIRLG
ncbi:MAG: nucleotidyltransferase family protein, partial [Phascolarctobacterium sp.]